MSAKEDDDPEFYASINPWYESQKGGSSFSFVQASISAIAPNGNVYVMWMDFETSLINTSYLKIKKSTNGGASFGTTTTAAEYIYKRFTIGSADISNIPSLAIDPTNGNLYAVYIDFPSPTSFYSRVKFIYSTNGGSSWSTPVVISDLGVSTDKQYFPCVSVDGSGRISVLFINYFSPYSNTYITESYDGGNSFRSPIKITTQGSNPSNGSKRHHYHGIVNIGNGYSYCIWNDYRNGNANPYFSKVNTPPAMPNNFAGTTYNNHPKITWDPCIESDVYNGGNIKVYRGYEDSGGFISYMLAATLSGNSTSWIDNEVTLGNPRTTTKYLYKISAVDFGGKESPTTDPIQFYGTGPLWKIGEDNHNIKIKTFSLNQNYPNPFNPTTKISYSIKEEGLVKLKVYDMLGKEVATLVNEKQPEGYYEVEFSAGNLPSGIYFYKMQAGNFTAVNKMLLVR